MYMPFTASTMYAELLSECGSVWILICSSTIIIYVCAALRYQMLPIRCTTPNTQSNRNHMIAKNRWHILKYFILPLYIFGHLNTILFLLSDVWANAPPLCRRRGRHIINVCVGAHIILFIHLWTIVCVRLWMRLCVAGWVCVCVCLCSMSIGSARLGARRAPSKFITTYHFIVFVRRSVRMMVCLYYFMGVSNMNVLRR